MKLVTEFWSHLLLPGLQLKTTLLAEGKTPEEIQAALGEKHKMEGDKLKHFINAIEVASKNMENLSRVLVVTLNEGESAHPKAMKIEEGHYIPEFKIAPKPVAQKAEVRGGGQKKGGKGKSGPKESPWGLSPEQKAAKKGKQP